MSVDVTDGTTTLNAYKLATQVGVGDVIVIYGKVGSYNDTKQIAEGATAEIKTAHVCSEWSTATCKELAACVVCGATTGEYADHSYGADGVCTVEGCGAQQGVTQSYTKVTSADQFTTGTYVITVKDTVAFGVYDNGWGTANTVAPTDNTIGKSEGDATALTITVTVNGDVVTATIKDKNGAFIAPKSGNQNGMTSSEYSWAVTFNEDGTVVFAGQGDDTTYLAYNSASGTEKFRAYKTSTCTGSNAATYPYAFTVYKLG